MIRALAVIGLAALIAWWLRREPTATAHLRPHDPFREPWGEL